jgi:hypothetical protein
MRMDVDEFAIGEEASMEGAASATRAGVCFGAGIKTT